MDWQELQHESLDDLVEYLQFEGSEENTALADAAFINLTFRFRQDLFEKCVVLCRKNKLTDTDAEEITNRVFSKLRRYPTFTKKKCKITVLEQCLRLYLYKIARNELVDYSTPDESPYTGEERIIASIVDPEVEYAPEKLRMLKEKEDELDQIFATLTPKHKIIYLTYKTHELKGKYLPKHLRTELRTFLGLSANTIRVYKKEAFELVKSKQNGR